MELRSRHCQTSNAAAKQANAIGAPRSLTGRRAASAISATNGNTLKMAAQKKAPGFRYLLVVTQPRNTSERTKRSVFPRSIASSGAKDNPAISNINASKLLADRMMSPALQSKEGTQ